MLNKLTSVIFASTALLMLGATSTASYSLTTPSLNQPPSRVENPALLAQRSHTFRIQFARGENSASVKNAVVRGTRDIYLLGAAKGQVMTVKIESLENNAVFDIETPSSKNRRSWTLKQEAMSWSGKLPTSGDYKVIVGTTRGNASYKLKVTIR